MSTIKILDGDGNEKYLSATGAGTESDPYVPIQGISDAGPTSLPLYQFADTVGDGTGDNNMAVDGSTTPVTFRCKPASGVIYRVARIIISVRDTGAFDSGGWGNLGSTPLTNGMLAQVIWNGTTNVLTNEPVQSHIDLAALSYDVSHHNWGSGDEFVVFRFTFTKAGQYIRLDGDTNDELQFLVRDDLTDLVQQRISVQGYVE